MTLRPIPLCLLALLALLLLSPASARAEDETGTPASHLAAAHADSVVSIQFVLKTRMTVMGQSRDTESTTEVRGVLLDETGFILTASSHFEGGMTGRVMRMMGQDVDIDATPSDIKVLFGEEEEEYPARLVAKDSDLGIAFLQILDLQGRAVKALELGNPATPVVGANLLGLTRMARSFDCAPQVSRLYVTAQVERPRPMVAVAGDFQAVGMPVFTRHGEVVGVLTLQGGTEGVAADEGGGGIMSLLSGGAQEMGLFVIPLSAVLSVVERAKAQAAKAAADESTEDTEDAEKPAEEGE